MKMRRAATWLFSAAMALFASLALPLQADRLHLEGGGQIDVERWWIEGDTVVYEAGGGTVGIPRVIIARIESRPLPDDPRPPDRSRSRAIDTRPVSSVQGDEAELRNMMRRAQQALDDREFELASSYFLRLIQERPELYAARVGYALSEIEMQHDGSALSVVLDGINRNPDRHELHVLLGELRYRDERLDDALVALRRAFSIEPSDALRERIFKLERELNASRYYDFASSSHFNLRYDGAVDVGLARAMLDYLEDQFWVVTEAYRHAPAQPITVQLFPLQEFREVTRAPDWAGGLYDGKIRLPLGGLSRLTTDAKRVLVHELTHAVIHSKSRGTAPRWLQEGLAQTGEGRILLRAERQSIARQLARIPDDRWSKIEFSYPIALSITEFLSSRGGLDGLVRLVDELGQGADLDQALARVYGQDYEQICHAWGRSLLDSEDE